MFLLGKIWNFLDLALEPNVRFQFGFHVAASLGVYQQQIYKPHSHTWCTFPLRVCVYIYILSIKETHARITRCQWAILRRTENEFPKWAFKFVSRDQSGGAQHSLPSAKLPSGPACATIDWNFADAIQHQFYHSNTRTSTDVSCMYTIYVTWNFLKKNWLNSKLTAFQHFYIFLYLTFSNQFTESWKLSYLILGENCKFRFYIILI